jgi:hypothetical protein
MDTERIKSRQTFLNAGLFVKMSIFHLDMNYLRIKVVGKNGRDFLRTGHSRVINQRRQHSASEAPSTC